MNRKGYEVYDAEIDDVIYVAETDDEAIAWRADYVKDMGISKRDAEYITIRRKM